MNFKIDTKDAFYVISPNRAEFTAKLAEEMQDIVTKSQKELNKSLIVNFENVSEIEVQAIETLNSLYEKTISDHKSFVICCLMHNVKEAFAKTNLLETINYTPTESEAWDIVQMEEIERELDSETD